MHLFDIPALGDTHRVAARHNRRPARAADRLGVEAGEFHAFPGHAVQVGSFDLRIVNTQCMPMLLIAGDEQNVCFHYKPSNFPFKPDALTP